MYIYKNVCIYRYMHTFLYYIYINYMYICIIYIKTCIFFCILYILHVYITVRDIPICTQGLTICLILILKFGHALELWYLNSGHWLSSFFLCLESCGNSGKNSLYNCELIVIEQRALWAFFTTYFESFRLKLWIYSTTSYRNLL